MKPLVAATNATPGDWLTTLVVLMVLDVALGILCATASKELNSTTSWVGMCRKIGMLLIVAVCVVLTPYTSGIAIGKIASFFFILTEGISCLENAGKLGIPVPAEVLNTLQKLKGAKAPVSGRRRSDRRDGPQ